MTVQPMQPRDRQAKKTAERANARRQREMDAEAVGIRIDGVDYIVNPNDITGRLEFEIRRQCGMGVAEIAAALERTQGIDYLGMFMWAVRHAHGEDVDLMDVLDGVSAGSDVEVLTKAALKAAAAEVPKASGSDS